MRQALPIAGYRAARATALVVPAALLAGAWGSQLFGGLYPCEMCHWQRWPHYAALALAALAFVAPDASLGRLLVWLAAGAIALSGAIGAFHAGVEYHWWAGVTECTATTSGHGGTPSEMLDRLLRAPIVRCDVPQWTLAGVSLAGFNALISLPAAAAIAVLLTRRVP